MTKKKILNTKAEEIGERTIRFKISSEVVDRDGDILFADGCDFSNFAKNPQFLGFHNSHDFPLGIPKNWKVENKEVFCDVYFPKIEELCTDTDNVSEKAKLVDFTYHCYKTGMLNAVSVGFIIKDCKPNKETGGLFVNSWELLEFSAVAVPANQDAIAQARKDFGSEKAGEMLTVEKTVADLENELAECRKELENCLAIIQKEKEEDVLILDDEFDLESLNIDK